MHHLRLHSVLNYWHMVTLTATAFHAVQGAKLSVTRRQLPHVKSAYLQHTWDISILLIYLASVFREHCTRRPHTTLGIQYCIQSLSFCVHHHDSDFTRVVHDFTRVVYDFTRIVHDFTRVVCDFTKVVCDFSWAVMWVEGGAEHKTTRFPPLRGVVSRRCLQWDHRLW